MQYEAHVFEQDRERVIRFVKDTDQAAVEWAIVQWESGAWTTTGHGLELRRPNGEVLYTRSRR